MFRRGFLGRVLGTIVATQLPWTEHPLHDAVLDAAIIGKKELPFSHWSRLQTAVRLADGTLLKGPGMKPIYTDLATRSVVIPFQDVDIHESMTATSAVLLTERGSIYREMPFSGGSQFMMNGDTLKVTFSVVTNETL